MSNNHKNYKKSILAKILSPITENWFLRSLKGESSKISFMIAWSLSAIYIISPVDAIPDLIPIIGWLDDLGLGVIILTQVPGLISNLVNSKMFPKKEGNVVDAEVTEKNSNTESKKF